LRPRGAGVRISVVSQYPHWRGRKSFHFGQRHGLPRFAVVGSPRSANTWLRRLLCELFDLEDRAIFTPEALDWDRLPERAAVQIHWPRERAFTQLLHGHGFKVCVVMRHPLDTLVSILQLAAHNPDTARWLGGAFGSERTIIGADPCSQAFVNYANSPRARSLIDISSQWWDRHATRIRFDDLVCDPALVLGRIARRSGVAPVISTDETMRRLPFSRMQDESSKHFWQGQSGLWRRLLPASYAEAVATPYRRHARRHGYYLTPDSGLTVEMAMHEWRILTCSDQAVKGAQYSVHTKRPLP
jgi:hypothetical protein